MSSFQASVLALTPRGKALNCCIIMLTFYAFQLLGMFYFCTLSAAKTVVQDDYKYPELQYVPERHTGKMVCYDWWLEHVRTITRLKCVKCDPNKPDKSWGTRKHKSCKKTCHPVQETTKKITRKVTREDPISPNQSLFTTPSIDGTYPRNHECVWYVCSSREETYHLELVQFDLQNTTTGKCLMDWFEIKREGRNGRLEGKLCGNLLGAKQYTINHQCLWLRFRSDAKVQGKGIQGWFAFHRELQTGTEGRDTTSQGLSKIKIHLMRNLMPMAAIYPSIPDHIDKIVHLTVNDSDAMQAIKILLKLSATNHKAATAIYKTLDLCSSNPISCLFRNITETTECKTSTHRPEDENSGSSSGSIIFGNKNLDYLSDDV